MEPARMHGFGDMLFRISMRMRLVCLGTCEPGMIFANGHAHYVINGNYIGF